MNDNDRKNLQFLLNASEDVFSDWYNSVSDDDHTYAAELLNAYRDEMTIKEEFYQAAAADLTKETVFEDANLYLKKYSLGRDQ